MDKQDTKTNLRIILHGNNGFKFSQFLSQLGLSGNDNIFETYKGRMEFFPFSDLNIFHQYSYLQPHPQLTALKQQNTEETAILVLISQTEIFSDGMRSMITGLPYNEFYGLNEMNEKGWWDKVIVVFSFGENDTGSEDKVKESISNNSGIREIVKKAGYRYIWMSNKTTPLELTEKLLTEIELTRRKNLQGKEQISIYKFAFKIIANLSVPVFVVCFLIIAIVVVLCVVLLL